MMGDVKRGVAVFVIIGLAPFVFIPTLAARDGSGGAEITRADFAAAYLRFETAFMKTKLSDVETVRVNREFDALTLLFFTRSYGPAILKLEALTLSLGTAPAGAVPAKLFAPEAFASMRPAAERNLARLEKVKAETPELRQALASVKARNKLLLDPPSPENTAQLVLDPKELARQIDREIWALLKGSDPFKKRTGDHWRVIQAGDREVPVRIFLSPKADQSKPLPLVIAFHGAGGDENMFMDGYGAGLIKSLAERNGFLLATPSTYAFAGTLAGERFDALISALSFDYAIEKKRVYVLGHSLGGGVANALASRRPAALAALACLSGFRGFTDAAGSIPPVLVVAAEHDPVAPPSRLGPAFQKAAAAGLPVEYRLVRNYGHTLSVTFILPEVIAWLLRHDRR